MELAYDYVVSVLPRRKYGTWQPCGEDVATHPHSLLLHGQASSTTHIAAETARMHACYPGMQACKVASCSLARVLCCRIEPLQGCSFSPRSAALTRTFL